MKVPIREDTMKTITISIAGLIEKSDGSESAIRRLIFGFEDIGNLSFRLVGVANDGRVES